MAEIVAQLERQVAAQNKELEYARLKIQVLEERLRLQRIQKYGPSSETLSNRKRQTKCMVGILATQAAGVMSAML
jgi:hypothetical protein